MSVNANGMIVKEIPQILVELDPSYNIKTLGWTTSAEIDPFKGFHLHALFTYQKPVYKNYNASVTFNDGSEMSVNANEMIVKEIPQILVELDPSYNITKDLRL